MTLIKRFFFKRATNNIGELLSILVIFSVLQMMNFDIMKEQPLFFILLILGVTVIFSVCVALFEKVLGDKNKAVGTGYYVLVIVLFIMVTTYIET